MSGVEALAAFSIACNVMQTISFAHEVFGIVQTLREGGSVDPDLDGFATQLGQLSGALQASLSNPPSVGSVGDLDELIKAAKRCVAATDTLKEELNKVSLGAKGKRLPAAFVGIKAVAKKRKFGRLEKNVMTCQKLLESRLLVRIW